LSLLSYDRFKEYILKGSAKLAEQVLAEVRLLLCVMCALCVRVCGSNSTHHCAPRFLRHSRADLCERCSAVCVAVCYWYGVSKLSHYCTLRLTLSRVATLLLT
jgi:NAD-dependent dihydropyrimidine dehydrogenase PreA subunit